MGAILKLIDTILFLFFILIALAAPLIDSQVIFPRNLYPNVLVDVMQWFAGEFDDYLVIERPRFYIGLVWNVILFMWPLSLFNLYAYLNSKSWYPTTCLMFGVSFFTCEVTVLSEIIGSGKATNKLMTINFSLIGFGILATLRGLVPHSDKTVSSIGQIPTITRKKRA